MTGPAGHEAVRDEETTLVERLREGDERAFEEAVVALFPAMLAVARGYVRTPSVAEEVVQEAWIAVLGHRPVRGDHQSGPDQHPCCRPGA